MILYLHIKIPSYLFPIISCILQIFLEQKKMLKTGLNIARFKQHISLIEWETLEYFARWGNAGERGINFLHYIFG